MTRLPNATRRSSTTPPSKSTGQKFPCTPCNQTKQINYIISKKWQGIDSFLKILQPAKFALFCTYHNIGKLTPTLLCDLIQN